MDDDGEFPASHRSPDTVDDGNDDRDTGSPRSASPEPANGRLITLALPIQTRRSTPNSSVTAAVVVGGGGGREDCWTEEATAVLIEAWGERYAEQSRGILKQKQWEEVAEIVSARAGASTGKPARTDVQCKNRIDTVKRKYKSEKAKIAAGAGPSNWIFFDRLDRLLGNGNPNSTASTVKISQAAASKNQAAFSISQQNHVFLRRNNSRTKRPMFLTVDSDSDSDDLSLESSDSLPPGANLYQRSSIRQKTEFNSPSLRPPKFTGFVTAPAGAASMKGQERVNEWSNSVRELTRVIAMFSEAYEQAESEKLQQMVEMEKQRMKFAKELELQRVKFLMKTQMQLSRLGRGLAGGGESNHHQGRHHNSHVNNLNNNSGCSN